MTLALHHRFLPILLAVVLAGCQSTPPGPTAPQASVQAGGVSYAGGDGSSIEKAVIIRATGHGNGVRAEYDWLRQQYPGYQRVSQSLLTPAGKAYDLIEIQTADGRALSVYFNISAFFGKF